MTTNVVSNENNEYLKYLLLSSKLIKDISSTDLNRIIRAIDRNYKYLKSENEKNTEGEEFLLNDLTLNLKTDLFIHLLKPLIKRNDIKFKFFQSFYTIDELSGINEVNECLISDMVSEANEQLTSLNNTGKLSKWFIMLNSLEYRSLISDINEFYFNSINIIKNNNKMENEDRENLKQLIGFNFFFLVIIYYLSLSKSSLIQLSILTKTNLV